MTIRMELPEYVEDTKNPAQRWVEDLQSELGFAEPFLNGTSMLTRAARFGGMGGGTVIWEIDQPTIRVDDLQRGRNYAAQHAPVVFQNLFGDEQEAADPRDETGEADWNLGRFSALVTRAPVNTFTWRVTVPPAGPWTAQGPAQGMVIMALALVAEAAQKGCGNPHIGIPQVVAAAQGGHAAVWTLEIVGGPNTTIGSLRTHTRAHETQHVIDHMHVVAAMMGPWDARIQELFESRTEITGPSSGDVQGAILKAVGFNPDNRHQAYTPGIRRIGEQIIQELVRAGNAFHRTTAGAVCNRRIRAIRNGHLTVEVWPVQPMIERTFISVESMQQAASAWRWSETYIHG